MGTNQKKFAASLSGPTAKLFAIDGGFVMLDRANIKAATAIINIKDDGAHARFNRFTS
jgi:hypothetical protein